MFKHGHRVAAFAMVVGLVPTGGYAQDIDILLALPASTLTFSSSFIAEDAGDQRRFYGAECHDHRAVDRHDITHARWRVSRGRRRMSRPEPLGLAATCRSRSTPRRPR